MSNQKIFIKRKQGEAEHQPFDFAASTATYGDLAAFVGYNINSGDILYAAVDGGRQDMVNITDSMTLVEGQRLDFHW